MQGTHDHPDASRRPTAAALLLAALVALTTLLGVAAGRADAAGARLAVSAERVTSGGEERLRVRVTGRTPRGGGPVRVAVSTVEPGSGCSVGRRDVDWRALSAIGPRTRVPAGRAFAMVGTAAVADAEAVRVCVTMRRVGGGVVGRAGTVVGGRVGSFLDPVVGRSTATTLEPVVRLVVPILLLGLLAGGGWVVAGRLRRRRAEAARRRAAIARRPSRPHRLAAHHAGGPTDRFTALPPLPDGIVIPDAPPSALVAGAAGDPLAAADVLPGDDELADEDPAAGTATLLPSTGEVPAGDPAAVPPARGVDRVARRLRSPKVRERRWRLERALQPLEPLVDEIVLPEPATGDSAIVVARRGRLAFLVLLAGDDPDADRRRVARLAATTRDERLGGLAPVPVLALRDAPVQPRPTPAHEDYPGLEIWTVSADRLERFVRARIPARRAAQRHRTG